MQRARINWMCYPILRRKMYIVEGTGTRECGFGLQCPAAANKFILKSTILQHA